MTAYLGHTNLIKDGIVTVTSEATGFEKENAYDDLPSDFWKASAAGTVYFTVDMGANTNIDWWGIGFHDLADNSGTIKPQYSNDNFAADTNDLDTVQTPSDGSYIFRKVTDPNQRYYRFEISSTGVASSIGDLYFGSADALQRGMRTGFTPPRFARDTKTMVNVSEGGASLGLTLIQEGYKFNISQDRVSTAWMDSNWLSLIQALEINKFRFIWDLENRPTEAIYAWLDGKQSMPSYESPLYQKFLLKCKGLIL